MIIFVGPGKRRAMGIPAHRCFTVSKHVRDGALFFAAKDRRVAAFADRVITQPSW